MSQIRCVFSATGPSGLPEDRINNVFHFEGILGYEADSPLAIAAVAQFYNAANTTFAVSEYLSPWVQRDATLTTYDMSLPKPRVPSSLPLTLNSVAGTSGLPEEVACCVTMVGAIPPALTARRRGRLYIGPLNTRAATAGSSTEPARPSAQFQADLAVAARRLQAHVDFQVVWAILSSVPAQNFVTVAGGYIDDAWDTQRRRGPRTTTRLVWTPA